METMIPDNVVNMAQSLVFFLGLPRQIQAYGADMCAACQTRLNQLIYSVTPEEALPELWAEVQEIRRMLGNGSK